MTTIVVDARKGTAVADNQAVTNGMEMMIPCTKLHRVERGEWKGAIYGYSGHEGPGEAVFEWLEQRRQDDGEPLELDHDLEEDFEALLLHDDGIFYIDRWLLPTEVDVEFYATGSGAPFAMGAMLAGASAQKAVKIACDCDPNSGAMGRPLQVMKL